MILAAKKAAAHSLTFKKYKSNKIKKVGLIYLPFFVKNFSFNSFNAGRETRTPTRLLSMAPKAIASANSAIPAFQLTLTDFLKSDINLAICN